MKKIAIVLCALSMFAGTLSAAEAELVKAGSFEWGRVGQRVVVGCASTLGATLAVQKWGAERVLGIAFGLGLAVAPALIREQKIGWNECWGRVGKRKELCVTVLIGSPVNIGGKIACGLPLLDNQDAGKCIAIAIGTLVGIAALNNSIEDRGAYLEQLHALNKKK
jgi:hypothetical protein